MKISASRFSGKRGITLVELMVSFALISFVTLAFAAGIAFNVRSIEANRRVGEALQVAQYYEGLIQGATFTDLGKPNLEDDNWSKQFSTDQYYTIDDKNGETRVYNATFSHTGWGPVDSATANTLTVDFQSNQDEWADDEWVGQYVVITSGRGKGQMMRISSNSNDTLTVTQDVTGGTNKNWAVIPDSTSRYFINNSKTVHIEVSWEGRRGNTEVFQRTVILPRPGGITF